MQEQGFELRTDKRSFWEWHKDILDVDECLVIINKQSTLQLLFGTPIGNCHYIMGSKLLNTINNPRTKSEDWRYFRYEGDLKELFNNVLMDMRDIIINNWEKVLEEQAIKYKEDVPNKKHFDIYMENYERLASDALEKYDMEGNSVLEVFDVVITQIQSLQGKSLEESENTLLELAAMLEKVILDTHGGERYVNENARTIVLLKVGKSKMSFDVLVRIFFMWENTMNLEEHRKEFLYWYKSVEPLKFK